MLTLNHEMNESQSQVTASAKNVLQSYLTVQHLQELSVCVHVSVSVRWSNAGALCVCLHVSVRWSNSQGIFW